MTKKEETVTTSQELAPMQPQEGLTLAQIKEYIAPLATDQEAFTFLRLCGTYQLNPFVGDAYLIKYKAGDKAAIVVGKDALLNRAQQAPDYQGHHAGVIAHRGSTVLEAEGAVIPIGAVLIGGWCRLNPRDKDPDPTTVRVSLDEYNRKQALWNTMPATMIRKVAVVQAHREAYPGLVRGMYDAAEMPVIIEGDAVRTTGNAPAPVPSTPTADVLPGTGEECIAHPGYTWAAGNFGQLYHYVQVDGKSQPCSPQKAYHDRIAPLCQALNIDGQKAVNERLKAKYGKTWSQLSLAEVKEFNADLELAAGVRVAQTTAGEPVDVVTGEVEPPPPQAEESEVTLTY